MARASPAWSHPPATSQPRDGRTMSAQTAVSSAEPAAGPARGPAGRGPASASRLPAAASRPRRRRRRWPASAPASCRRPGLRASPAAAPARQRDARSAAAWPGRGLASCSRTCSRGCLVAGQLVSGRPRREPGPRRPGSPSSHTDAGRPRRGCPWRSRRRRSRTAHPGSRAGSPAPGPGRARCRAWRACSPWWASTRRITSSLRGVRYSCVVVSCA